ncbi:MAG: hypothetical protein A2741_00580 [Candidatus Zambryskibacteria bacterium RIFCSPHIGHO2_01_FULL_43_27]|uniref:AI-2E family transporter n=1 Tax=Candidatus Zambryskibacteria bacterium RIFCSPLOWO2_01_FULL_43_17 TaxID=1802760 RepID=A0A1G2U3Q4_9BACT|nr:MAG: hypothetical protein A2741_00580 [Candidatus Zambryskibacteria bacterium RIFCSPHIGHO2_01_FULL_43_27]OHA99636.1 MAG: hypothetical protein A3E93_00700 [Candidatus Zambryskibacteria bacterium RIFCSPHIGHO2_12_FULL_43_12b]OHB04123.1 MAG: hypothetical protein A2920_02175 [Candidatus Zambryskibacteria bacterium RIFCSPLOWO2_01_FULL_43_17]
MAMQNIQTWFFFVFIIAVIVLNIFIFLPYLSILFLALVFAIIFGPMHERILAWSGGKNTLSSLLSVLVVLLVIVGPLSFFGTLLFQEASDLYVQALDMSDGDISGSLKNVSATLENLVPGFSFSQAGIDIAQYARQGLSWLLDHMSILFSGVAKITFGLFLMLLALFYFFKDGKKFVDSLVDLSPLADSSDRKIISKIILAVNSVVRGSIVIGVFQGILTGLGFAIFGVPNPVIWGFVAAIASLVPTIGTSIILIPAIAFLFLTGATGQGVGLIIWGVIAVGLIDNLLGPILIERGVKIHPFLILLSALGGLALFGPVGFLAGPVVLALLFALMDLYPSMVRS